LVCVLLFASVSQAQSVDPQASPVASPRTMQWPVGEIQPFALESEAEANRTDVALTVWEKAITIPNAAWLRLYFGEAELQPGSFVRITSTLDGEVQELDAAALAMWSYSTAYFNGDTVVLSLIAAPGTTANRITVSHVGVQIIEGGPRACGVDGCGYCGADDREPSTELWTGRLMPTGCTASIYNEMSCAVTAGHCVDGGGATVLQFNVPNSQSNCNPVNPPVADQFPVTGSQYSNNGVGDDWGVLTIGTNGSGQRPVDRYGVYRPIAANPANSGAAVAVWGYGVDDSPSPTRSQTQQTSAGVIGARYGSFYTHTVDVTYGNSGSALIHNNEIIGIISHCSYDCNNIATRVDVAAFVNARNALCATTNDLCGGAIQVTNGTYNGTTVGATRDGSASCGSSSTTVDVWYRFTAYSSGTLTVDTCAAASYNTVLSIHSGCPGTTANQIACNDNSNNCGPGSTRSYLSISATEGSSYYIRVSGNNGATGTFTLTVNGPGDLTPPTPNPMEFSTPPYADSTTSIRMIAALATDAISPPVQYFFDFVSGGSGGNDSAWQDARMYLDTGLEVNTQYTYRVKARDTAPNLNETAYSAQYTVATFAAVPPPPVLSGAAYNSLVVDPQPGANPPHTHLAIQCTASNPNDPNWTGKFVAANGSPTAAAVWQTDAAWAAKTVTGLQPSTSYSFAVKARNLDGLETALGSAASLSTTSGPTGACCFEDGFCWVATLTDCGFSGGSYQGDAVPCDPNPCPQPIGACCFPNGTCSIELEDDCWLAGGDFQGIGTTCSPNPCPQPTGACCAADGSCSVLTQAQCTASGGTYQGNGTGCSPNPCPQPTGACCAANGSCSVVTQAQCTASGGTYQGNGTGCSPNPCPQPCPLLGDLNGDGVVNGLDIQGFVNALMTNYHPCADLAAPQGTLDMNDLASFVNALLSAP